MPTTPTKPDATCNVVWCKPVKRLLASGLSLWEATGRLARKSEPPKRERRVA